MDTKASKLLSKLMQIQIPQQRRFWHYIFGSTSYALDFANLPCTGQTCGNINLIFNFHKTSTIFANLREVACLTAGMMQSDHTTNNYFVSLICINRFSNSITHKNKYNQINDNFLFPRLSILLFSPLGYRKLKRMTRAIVQSFLFRSDSLRFSLQQTE